MDALDPRTPLMKNVAGHAGKLLYIGFLESVNHIQAIYTGECDSYPFPFDTDDYETIDDLNTEDAPKKKRPVTISTEAKVALAAMFSAIISTVRAGGKLPEKVRTHLLNREEDPTGVHTRYLVQVVEAIEPILNREGVTRTGGTVQYMQKKIVELVDEKLVTPGAEAVATVFVQFIKAVAWMSANQFVENPGTLNLKHLLGVFRCFRAFHQVEFNETTLDYVRQQVALYNTPLPNDVVVAARGDNVEVAQLRTALAAAEAKARETEEKLAAFTANADALAAAAEAAAGAAGDSVSAEADAPADDAAEASAPEPAPAPAPAAAPAAAPAPAASAKASAAAAAAAAKAPAAAAAAAAKAPAAPAANAAAKAAQAALANAAAAKANGIKPAASAAKPVPPPASAKPAAPAAGAAAKAAAGPSDSVDLDELFA